MALIMEMLHSRPYRIVSNDQIVVTLKSPTPIRRHVNIHDREVVKLWCRQFGVTPLKLCAVVDKVGTDPLAVQNALRIR